MKRASRTTLFAAAVMAAAVNTPALAEDTCNNEPVRYELRHAGENRFEIRAEFAATRGIFDLFWRPAEGTQDGTVDFISNFEVRNTQGEWSTPVYEGQGTWRADNAGASDIDALRYVLTADHDRASWDIGKEEIAYRFDDAFYFTGNVALIADHGWGDCRFEITFDVPNGWTTVAPWASDDGRKFYTGGVRALVRNIFVTGPGLAPRTAGFGGMDVVMLEQESLRADAATFEELLADSIGHYVDIFGSAPVDNYLVVFGEDNFNDGGAFMHSFGQRMRAPLRESEKLMWSRTLAHEALHRWLGITIRPSNAWELQWFTEGGADYLTGKTLYRSSQIDEHDMIYIIEGQVRRFFLGRISSGPVDIATAGQSKQENRQLVYGAGALFHLFLDAHLTASKGAGEYEALLRSLYEDSNEPYSFERLMAALDEASDGQASEIYAFLNAPFNPFAVMDRLAIYGVTTSAFGPDEILVRFSANGCEGSRHAQCMPDFMAR